MKKPIKKICLVVLLCCILMTGYSQKIATLEVVLSKAAYGLEIPVSIVLDDLTYASDTLLSLFEIKSSGRIATPFQVEAGSPRKLYWTILSGNTPGKTYLRTGTG